MLAGCTAALVADGWHVVLPSRRHAPIPVDATAEWRAEATNGPTRQALWVATDWSDPLDLADRAGRALGGPADLLVAWVHEAHRVPVLKAVAPLLAPGAAVVEVHGSDAANRAGGIPEPVLPDHPTQQVVLGFVPIGRTTRWLNHKEISAGVLAAVRRALAGKPPAVHQVGELPAVVVR